MHNMFEEAPAHERYKFGSLERGECVMIPLDGENPAKIRGHIGAHGQYYGKKFRTKTVGSNLYIARIQ